MMTKQTKPSATIPRETVFVVDDDPAMQRLLLLNLQQAGLSAQAFESAEQFLAALTPQSHGCILLDINLPGISGTELQSILKQRGVYLPVIFLSGVVNVPVTAAVMRKGAFDVIEKPSGCPFDLDALVAVVRSALSAADLARTETQQSALIAQLKATLTPRERDVAGLVAAGFSNKQIAWELGISDRTVEIHKSRVMAKMQCDNLARFVLRWAGTTKRESDEFSK